MKRLYLAFLRAVSVGAISRTGVIMVSSSTLTFFAIESLRLLGVITNQYVGLITYMALPALFLAGLGLIPIGLFRVARAQGTTLRELLNRRLDPADTEAQEVGSRLFRTVLILTLLNVLLLGVFGARTLHFMDQAEFCGTACHQVMGPEWATYQESPHAHVKCVECHVGEGVDALIDSKLNGLWQVISASLHLYEKPIPTPVRQLRPAQETCEHCHWPDLFLGDRILQKVTYSLDSANTARYTTLLMKIGSGREGKTGSHWHVAAGNTVRYTSLDDEREKILSVQSMHADGEWSTWKRGDTDDNLAESAADWRVMDCVDCHNRATHIYEDPEQAVDLRLAHGNMDASLPFLKREALGALLGSYGDDKERGLRGIELRLRGFYKRYNPNLLATHSEQIDRAIEKTRAIYERNIHPGMNVTWNVHPEHLGHRGGGGCFRCHGAGLVNELGEAISGDRSLCHSILAYDSDSPYAFLTEAPDDSSSRPDAAMHRFLKKEFEQHIAP